MIPWGPDMIDGPWVAIGDWAATRSEQTQTTRTSVRLAAVEARFIGMEILSPQPPAALHRVARLEAAPLESIGPTGPY